MELNITTDLTTAIPSEISFNFEELKAELTERLDHYNRLVITEDSIKEGKADRAKLNKLAQALDARRKEVKKICLAPYEAFEKQVKEILAMINAPIAAIDSQLSAYEEMRKEERRNEIVEAYDAIVPEELREIIPLERIYSTKWENATTKIKAVETDLIDRVKRTQADMMVLDTLEAEYSLAVREVYMQTLDIQTAVAKREALKKAAEAYRQVTTPISQPAEEKPTEAKNEPQKPQEKPEETDTVYKLKLEFYVTRSQANALKAFLEENNINYSKI